MGRQRQHLRRAASVRLPGRPWAPPPWAAKRNISKYETMWNRAATKAATKTPHLQPLLPDGAAHRARLPNPVDLKPSEVLRETCAMDVEKWVCSELLGGIECVF